MPNVFVIIPGDGGRVGGAAELAGPGPAEVTRPAIGSRDRTGARDIARVCDARIRQLPLQQRGPAERPGR
jgi:hypothetical protein